MGKRLTFLSASALIAGFTCAAMGAELNTDYAVSNQGGLGITRAFDDGANTVLAFVDLDAQSPVLTDASGKKIPFQRVDSYAVLPGHFTEVRVTMGKETGVVKAASNQAALDRPILPVAQVGRGSTGSSPAATPVSTAASPPNSGPVSSTAGSSRQPLPMLDPAKQPLVNAYDVASQGAKPTAKSPATVSGVPAPTTAAPPAASSMPAPAKPTAAPAWEGAAGSDAKTMLTAWAAKANWHVEWDFERTFPIPSAVRYEGDFVSAVSAHFTVYTDRRRTKTPICLDMHEGNKTVHVYPRDESNRCELSNTKQVAP